MKRQGKKPKQAELRRLINKADREVNEKVRAAQKVGAKRTT